MLYTVTLLNPEGEIFNSEEDGNNYNVKSSNGPPGVVVYVNSTIYHLIQPEVLRYVQDVTDQGYNVTLINCSITDVNALKLNISGYYNYSLDGVVLIGELPYAIARFTDGWGIHDFPTDLFLMDMDGLWQDFPIPPAGIYDIDYANSKIEHTNGSGDWEPEIWLGRISPYSMGMPGINYTQELIDYFDRNHDYRTGVLSRPHKACLYIDDEWSGLKDEWVSNFTAYTGSSVDVYATDAYTNMTDYTQQINKTDYEFIHLLVHSWQTNHTFGPSGNGADGVLTYNHIYGNNTRALFYNLFACYSCDFTFPNNTGTYYLFGNDSLVVIGSARSGGMDLYQPFYDNLTQNTTIGEAFKNWFYNPEIETLNPPNGKTDLYYGMTIFGDPLLTIHMNDSPPESITVTNPTSSSTWYKTEQYEIKWAWTGGFTTVYISLHNASVAVLTLTTAGGTPNDGSFLWTVPSTLADGSEYFIKIDGFVGIPSDMSDNFTIAIKPADPPSNTPPGGGGGIPGADIILLGIICSIITISIVQKKRKLINI